MYLSLSYDVNVRSALDVAELIVNTTNATKCEPIKCHYLQWLYLIAATCFGPCLGPSSGSLFKYVSCY
jgi:hypothetical protein